MTYFGYPEPDGCRNAVVRGAIALLIMLGLLFAVALSTSSCKSIKCIPNTEYVYSTDTITRWRTDSLTFYQRDSIILREKGDTVFIDHWRDRWREHIVYVADTALHSGDHEKTETQIVEVIPNYYMNCSWALWILVGLIVAYIVIRILIRVYLKK